jgi:hypothetical protein
MGYRNPLHGLDADGHSSSMRTGSIPAVTADETPTTDQVAIPGTPVIDMAYLNQIELEHRLAHGQPLPEGITEDDVRSWRAAHPDFDPAAPLGGQPVPPGMRVEVRHVDVPPGVTGHPLGRAQTVGVGPDQWPVKLTPPPIESCPAATGALTPGDSVRCPRGAQGEHRCVKPPTHTPVAPVGGQVPQDSGADHQCACDFVWASASGGVSGMIQQADRLATSTVGKFAAAVIRVLTTHVTDPEELAAATNAIGKITADWTGESA